MKAKLRVKKVAGTSRILPANDVAELMIEIIRYRAGYPKGFNLDKLDMFAKLGVKFQIIECDDDATSRYTASIIDSMGGNNGRSKDRSSA